MEEMEKRRGIRGFPEFPIESMPFPPPPLSLSFSREGEKEARREGESSQRDTASTRDKEHAY